MTDEHDELRARLQAADPAASLARPDPDRVARLLEETMSHPQTTTEPRPDNPPARSPLTWLVAAAAVVLIAAVGAFVLASPSDNGGSTTAGSEPSDDASVTELSASGAAATAGRCLPVTEDALAEADVAFDGIVEDIEGDLVTLRVTEWYAGEETDLVTVKGPSEDLQALLAAVDFQDDERYLVAATPDGKVMVCGFSAPHSPRLERLYDQAFNR